MKLKPFLISGLLTAGAVLLYDKKDTLFSEFKETKESITKAQKDLTHIKNNLAFIQEEQSTLKDISQDLTYKFRVFNKEIQAHLREIQKISDKYQRSSK